MLNEKLHIPICELVAENPKLGFVLHAQGIKFYEHSDSTISAISQNYAFNLKQFISQCNWQYQYQLFQNPLLLHKHSAGDVILYLRYMHRIFVKEKLPYFAALIQDIEQSDDKRIADLKWVFPYFLEDFVHHIFDEEDHLFKYIHSMVKAIAAKRTPAALWMEMETKSIAAYALQHSLDDDEMAGIRSLTSQYKHLPSDSLALRVLYYELMEFEKELQFHARVENEVLFPKALTLENTLRAMLHQQTNHN